MFGWHSSRLVRWGLHQAGGLLSYRREVPAAHVFSDPPSPAPPPPSAG